MLLSNSHFRMKTPCAATPWSFYLANPAIHTATCCRPALGKLPIAHRWCERYGFSFCARPPIPVAPLLAAFPHVALKVAFDKFYTTWLVKTQVAVAEAAHCFHSEWTVCLWLRSRCEIRKAAEFRRSSQRRRLPKQSHINSIGKTRRDWFPDLSDPD